MHRTSPGSLIPINAHCFRNSPRLVYRFQPRRRPVRSYQGRWPRFSQSSQTMNEGAPGPSHLGTRDAANPDSCDLNHDEPISPAKRPLLQKFTQPGLQPPVAMPTYEELSSPRRSVPVSTSISAHAAASSTESVRKGPGWRSQFCDLGSHDPPHASAEAKSWKLKAVSRTPFFVIRVPAATRNPPLSRPRRIHIPLISLC